MPRFQDIVTDNEGNGLPGAIVTVRDYPSGNLSTLTADGGGSLTNPIVADSNGTYYFNAANAIYSLEFRLLPYEPAREVRLVNLGNLVDSDTLADSTSAANGAGLIGFNSTLSYVTGTVGGFLKSLPTTGGAALIGANDASSGSIFTTVAGFIAKLLSSAGSSVIGFVQSGTGAVFRFVQDKLRDRVSVKDFGAVGDGVTNDWPAITLAIAAARGRALFFPKGNYVCNTDGGTITLEEVDLIGECVLDGATSAIDEGSMLWITGTTNSPFKVRRGVSVEGLGIYYPNQPDSATPVTYPTTFVFDFTNGAVQFVNIRRNVIYNAYRFIDIDNGSTGAVGHVEIEANYICALNRAIYLRYNSEHLRIERNNFTFSHWLAATEAGARAYMRLNATAFQVDQSDGAEFVDNLVFGHLNGVLAAATGLCQFMKINDNKLDQVRYGVKATGSGNFGGQILGNTFNAFNSQSTTLQGRSIDIETTGSAFELILITSNAFAEATEDHIYISGNTPTREIVIGPNTYLSWAALKAAGAYGAINANGSLTNIQITGGWFYGTNSAAYSNGIMGSCNIVQLTGAYFNGCLAPVNITAVSYQSANNRSANTGGATSNIVSSSDIKATANYWDKPAATVASISAATYTAGPLDQEIIFSAACTLTLPSAATSADRELRLLTTGANAIISASSNVVALTGGAAGTAILAATAGKWATLRPVGSNWQIVSAN